MKLTNKDFSQSGRVQFFDYRRRLIADLDWDTAIQKMPLPLLCGRIKVITFPERMRGELTPTQKET